MNLRKKTLVMIGATLLALVLILFASSEALLMNGLGNLEKQNIAHDVKRAENAINQEIYSLNGLNEDWASWDDTYNFLKDNNTKFIASNLGNSTFKSLKLDLILFLDSEGNLFYVRAIDSNGTLTSIVPSGMDNYISNSSSLVIKNTSTSVKGLINLDNGPMMISAQPILTSNGKGPSRGTLIMGRYMDEEGIGIISNITQISLKGAGLKNMANASDDFKTAKTFFNDDNPIVIQNLNSDSIAGYVILQDIEGNPAMLLRVNESRSLYNEGQNSIFYFILMLMIAGVVMGLSILFYLDKAILSKLFVLTNNVKIIGKSKNFSGRIPVNGDGDELSQFAQSINVMLEKLEKSHIILAKSEERFRQLAENIEEVFWIFDVNKGNFLYLSPAYEKIWGHNVESVCKNPKKWIEYVHPDDKSIIKNFFPFPHNSKGDTTVEYRIITSDNEIKWIRSHFSVITDDRGEVNRLVGISEEITERKKHERELENTKNRLDFLISATPAVIYTVDNNPPYKTNFISENVEKVLGYDIEKFLADPYFWTKKIHPDDLHQAELDMELLVEKGHHTYEYRIKKSDGTYIWLRDDANVVKDEEGKAVEIAGYWIDITKRKKAEKALAKSESIYRTIFENTGTATAMIKKDMTISLINTEFEKLSGYTKNEIEGRLKYTDMIFEKESEKVDECHRQNMEYPDLNPCNYETILRDHSGDLKNIMVTIALIPEMEYTLASIIDVTEHKKADNKIRSSLKEKEILLRELHHRVKNNLQVISSLLSLQSRYIDDEEVLNLFKDSQNRVKSMTLVHEKLYQSQNLSEVDLKVYVKELAGVIFRSYGVSTSKVTLDLDIEQSVELNTAIPLGLIITELLTNSLKYAFPSKESGEIKISFHENDSGKYVLKVADNGVGLPEGLDVMKSKSLGLRLVRTLANQLGGDIEIGNPPGANFKIIF
ncbi:PAS domain S-box protein [Methanobacterium alcaliphilum]|uniref:PAS domain S-box protein n=1 Tax=Methanobacterium alcaliphilum TaxID=392018 RepID=UPI00200B4829|nr:PAS domain S-box protein [Methanobacterium alcaliphilum]MCK9152367.1 PAS domain S-box protein [Methanobacterium alcaliphilum]